MNLIPKSQMVSLLKQYKRTLVWFISGLFLAVLLFFGTSNQQPATASNPASNQSHTTPSTQLDVTPTYSDFGATHLEPNFYQY
ncbi:hypothetical protein [Nostoc sp.]|uniref:hypothetical protein n=1 Tax=Nostoc sp. TaxID=1180 RepID=UPI002FFB32FC